MRTKRRALSPVISTVILAAVSIAVAVSASLWMSGLANSYISTELLDVSMRTEAVPTGWNISVTLKNSGPNTISFTDSYFNGQPLELTGNATGFDSLLSGESREDYIFIPSADSSAGTTVKIEIRTASGMKYPLLVVLS